MKKILFICFFLAALLVNAQSLTGVDIMTKSVHAISSDNETVNIKMKLINSRGKERERYLHQYIKNDQDNNRSSLVKFLSPSDVKGTGFLSIEYTDKNDAQWLYLPALRRSRRISASDEKDSFMGSDFTYEDIRREKLVAYTYKLIGDVNIEGKEYYQIEAIPANEIKKENSAYGKREIAVDKENYIFKEIKYFNKNEAHVKTYMASDVKLVEGSDKWRAYKMEMTSLKTNHRTLLIFDNYKINSTLEDDTFTKRNLESFN